MSRYSVSKMTCHRTQRAELAMQKHELAATDAHLILEHLVQVHLAQVLDVGHPPLPLRHVVKLHADTDLLQHGVTQRDTDRVPFVQPCNAQDVLSRSNASHT